MKYAVVLERCQTGWAAYPPDLPGVGVTAATRDQALAFVRKAIEMHIAGLREDGLPVPPAVTDVDRIEIA